MTGVRSGRDPAAPSPSCSPREGYEKDDRLADHRGTQMTLLNSSNLATIEKSVPVPTYDREQVRTGIVHIGGRRLPPCPRGDVRRHADGARRRP